MFYYSAYSLKILSEVELPGFRSEQSGGEDISIKKRLKDQDVALVNKKVAFFITENSIEFIFPFGSKFVVSQGSSITIISRGETDPRLEALALQGVVFAALMSQRGKMVLHASAIELQGRAVILVGDKGQGKTTLGLKLLSMGGRLLSDDVTVLSFENGRAMILPGPPSVKAWPDSLGHIGVDPHSCPRLFEETDKRLYCVPVSATSSTPIELIRLFFLKETDSVVIRKMGGADKLMTLGANVYLARFEGSRTGGEIGRDFMHGAHLAQHYEAYVVGHPRKSGRLEETCRKILRVL